MEDNYPEDLDYMSNYIEEKDLKEEFQKYVKKHNIIPPSYSVTTTTMKKQDDDLKEIFGLFIAVVSRLMGPDGNEPEKIDRYVKLFLRNYWTMWPASLLVRSHRKRRKVPAIHCYVRHPIS